MIVTVFICKRDLQLGVRCLSSLLKFNREEVVQFRFHDDGSLDNSDAEFLGQAFPNSVLITRAEADEKMQDRLSGRPNSARFRSRWPLSLKLLDVMELAEEALVVYCDTDVLFFREFNGLQAAAENNPAIFGVDRGSCYSIQGISACRDSGIQLLAEINTGFFSAKQQIYDPELIEWLLGHPSITWNHWTEQTCWAIMAQQFNCLQWSPKHVRVMDESSVNDQLLIAGHFTKPVRHLLDNIVHNLEVCVRPESVILQTVPCRQLL